MAVDRFVGRARSAKRFDSTRSMEAVERLSEYGLPGTMTKPRTSAFL